jgi:hypothetical protein
VSTHALSDGVGVGVCGVVVNCVVVVNPLRCAVCCAVLCCAVLCCAVLCCAVLCCAVLWHVYEPSFAADNSTAIAAMQPFCGADGLAFADQRVASGVLGVRAVVDRSASLPSTAASDVYLRTRMRLGLAEGYGGRCVAPPTGAAVCATVLVVVRVRVSAVMVVLKARGRR